MDYREITVSDIPKIAPFYAAAFNSAPWFDKWTEETAGRRLLNQAKSENFYGLAAVEDGKIICAAFGEKEQYFDGIIFNLKEFFTNNNYRGKGIGTALIKKLEENLRSAGIREITLFTTSEDEGFYNNRGYKKADGMLMMNKTL